MSEKTPCDHFNETIDAYIAGDLSPEDEEDLREHLEHCEECRALLRLVCHTHEHSPDRIRSAMPAGLDTDMWRRVSDSIPVSSIGHGPRNGPVRSWFMPLLAAAAAVLLFMNGYLMGELRQYRQKEERIISYLSDRERGMERFSGAEADWDQRSVKLSQFGQMMLRFRPDQRMSIDEWIAMLSRIPPEATVLTVSDLSRTYGPFEGRYRGFDRYGFDIEDGIQVNEAISLLTSNYGDLNRIVTLREMLDEIPLKVRTEHRRNIPGSVMLQTTKGNQP